MRAPSCSGVIALGLAILSLAGAQVAEQSDNEKDFSVDYSGIDDVDRPYTLDKLIKGGVFNYEEEAAAAASAIIKTTDMPEEINTGTAQQEEQATDEPRFEVDPETKRQEALADEMQQSSLIGGKILSPTAAAKGQFPFYVYVKAVQKDDGKQMHCGGVLLSEEWVLTAAQCIARASTAEVVGGIVNTTSSVSKSSRVSAYIHPGYRSNFLVHDVALLRLEDPFDLENEESISAAKMPQAGDELNLDDKILRSVGFGYENNSTDISSTLNYVDLVQINKTKCNKHTEEIYVIYPGNTACLSSSNSTKGFCYGDIGGPVIYTYSGDSTPTVVGINSQHQGCPSEYPMAYTKIQPYLPWIKRIVPDLLL